MGIKDYFYISAETKFSQQLTASQKSDCCQADLCSVPPPCHQCQEDGHKGQTRSSPPHSPYPSNFRSPRHHDGVGDSGGQPDERGYIYGAAGPFWFNAILCGREISLQSKQKTKQNRKYVT